MPASLSFFLLALARRAAVEEVRIDEFRDALPECGAVYVGRTEVKTAQDSRLDHVVDDIGEAAVVPRRSRPRPDARARDIELRCVAAEKRLRAVHQPAIPAVGTRRFVRVRRQRQE